MHPANASYKFQSAARISCDPRVTQSVVALGLAAGMFVSSGLFGPFASRASAERPAEPVTTIGGYVQGPQAFYDSFLKQEQAKYIREAAELDRIIADCRSSSSACNPHIKVFADFRDRVRAIPDELTKAEVANTGINLIPYDYAEAQRDEAGNTSNLDHHSLREAIELNLAICDESAELKTYVIDTPNIRWVALNYYKGGVRQKVGHAIAVINIHGKSWTMDNQSAAIDSGALSRTSALNIIIGGARLEAAATQLNFSGHDFWSAKGDLFVPREEFNATQAAHYQAGDPAPDLSNVPAEALNAPEDTVTLDEATLSKYDVLHIVGPQMALRYTIAEPQPALVSLAPDLRGSIAPDPAPLSIVPASASAPDLRGSIQEDPVKPPLRGFIQEEPVHPALRSSVFPNVRVSTDVRGSYAQTWLAQQCRAGVQHDCR